MCSLFISVEQSNAPSCVWHWTLARKTSVCCSALHSWHKLMLFSESELPLSLAHTLSLTIVLIDSQTDRQTNTLTTDAKH